MKQILSLFFFLFTALSVSAQNNQWTWVGGDNVINQPAVYGSKGVAAPANKPGARTEGNMWIDLSGNVWIFGGNLVSGIFQNDLWKFDPSTGLWTWVGGDNAPFQKSTFGVRGVPASGNVPQARSRATNWTDLNGNLWLFGGVGYTASGSGYLNDLWRFTPASGLWAWMGGDTIPVQPGVYGVRGMASSTNKPGIRAAASGAADLLGNLWLFGGQAFFNLGNTVYYNDLWKYNTTTNQWTWVSGDNITDQQPVYGTKGMAAPSNKPGARHLSTLQTDASGNVLLFGGEVKLQPAGLGNSNDLWKYSPSIDQWTWISGDNINQQPGVYGTKGVAAAANKPGSRSAAVSWMDKSDNFWLFGGIGGFNDLWKYSLSTGLWTWVSGESTNRVSVYGTKGVSAPANTPGNRVFAMSAKDRSDNLWLFGGDGYATSANSGNLNDLWKFTITGSSSNATAAPALFSVIGNPVSSLLHVNLQLPARQPLTLEVSDINGHPLISEQKTGTQGSSVYSIPVDRLSGGTYIIRIRSKDVNLTKTFIKL